MGLFFVVVVGFLLWGMGGGGWGVGVGTGWIVTLNQNNLSGVFKS